MSNANARLQVRENTDENAWKDVGHKAGNLSLPITIVADDVGIGGGTQYAEDSVHASGHLGTMALAVHNTSNSLAPSGDYTPLSTDAGGNLRTALYSGNAEIAAIPSGGDGSNNTSRGLRVYNRNEVFNGTTWDRLRGDVRGVHISDIKDSAGDSLIDAANNALQVNIVAGAAAGGTSALDDADFTAGATAGTPVMGVYQSTPTAVTDGDLGIVGIDADRNLKVNVVAGSAAGVAAYSDSGATDRSGLVDADRHVQVDVLSSALPTGAATAANQQTDALTDTQLRATPVPVSGTITANLSATDNAVLDQVELNTSYGDNTGGGTEAGALRVTVANNSTGVLSVDDNGGSLTVDGTVGVSGTVTVDLGVNNDVTTELTTGDLDTGAGTDTRAVVGMVLAESGGGVLVGSANPLPVTGTFWQATQPVSGTVTANLSATDNAVLDQIELNQDTQTGVLNTIDSDTGGILTAVQLIDNAVSGAGFNITQLNGAAVPIGAGLEATALRVTLATDSTGVVSVDDGGGVLTVDGTVTANLSATDNAVLDQIELNTDPLLVVGGGTEATAQRVTIANNSTGVLSVDDNGGSLTVDGAVTANAGTNLNTSALALETTATSIKTAVEIIDNAIAGTEMQVDVVAALPAGTNNIGDVDVLTLPGDTVADIGALESDTDSSTMWADGAEVVVKRAVISAATSGDNTLVAAVVGKNIRVISLFLVVASEVAVRFESGAAGTALSGIMTITDHSGLVLPENKGGWFETADNTLLNLELGGAIQVSGSLTYIEV